MIEVFALLVYIGGVAKLSGYGWRRWVWPYYLGRWMARLPRDEVGFARDNRRKDVASAVHDSGRRSGDRDSLL